MPHVVREGVDVDARDVLRLGRLALLNSFFRLRFCRLRVVYHRVEELLLLVERLTQVLAEWFRLEPLADATGDASGDGDDETVPCRSALWRLMKL
jgi:hypothetical protein